LGKDYFELFYNEYNKMEKYEYTSVNLEFSPWSGRSKTDYLEVLNEYGANGWRFIEFTPRHLTPKGVKGVDLLFERKISD